MNKNILEILEFDKVRSLLEPLLVTEQGKKELQGIGPMIETSRIQQAFDELKDMADLFVHYPHFTLGATQEIGPAMRRLDLEADLNITELLAVKRVLTVSKELADFYANLENVQLRQLDTLFEKMETFPNLQGALMAVHDGGFIEDFASEELLKIRRQIQEKESQVRQVLQDLLKTKADMLSDTLSRIQQAFDELKDMADLFVHYPHFTLGATQEIGPAMRRLDLEADLNITELLAVKRVLTVSKELADFYANLENVQLRQLDTLFEKMETFPNLQGALMAVHDGGFIEDFASEELLKIRRQIQEKESQVRQVLQDLLKTKADMLSDTLLASRNGRNVLPVKNTYRNRVAGIVHDISSSGSTVYIEPRAVVSLNEEVTHLRAEERHEIARILREMSRLLRPHSGIIGNNAWIIGHLDLVRAKHLFARAYDAVVPALSDRQDIAFLNVRHPLISNPVANDLTFGSQLKIIVMTGPNTGGKTIMLKTLGLTHLMAQSGLPILADKGSRVAVFNEIFADIGDEQSIEQSLSTFSSHMTHIVEIMKHADENSLVLLAT